MCVICWRGNSLPYVSIDWRNYGSVIHLRCLPFHISGRELAGAMPGLWKREHHQENKKDEQERKLVLPAVRPATADEIAEHKKALMEIAAEDAFADRIHEPQNYDMSMGEHNLALMLLFYFRNCPIPYLRIKLSVLLDESHEGKKTAENALQLYTNVKKHFSSEIGKERRQFDTDDALPHGPALDVLYAFRQKEIATLMGNTPNLGDVRRVDVKEIVEKPSKEFVRFLTDWYNQSQSAEISGAKNRLPQ